MDRQTRTLGMGSQLDLVGWGEGTFWEIKKYSTCTTLHMANRVGLRGEGGFVLHQEQQELGTRKFLGGKVFVCDTNV